MIPTRVSHNPIIAPGVVPFGVDPAYDAQYKLNQAPRSHVASHGQGKPFTVEPGPHQRTQYPYVTGTTVLGCKYKDGVMIACDTLCCYGSTKRYKSVERIKKVNSSTIISFTGELSDFHYIVSLLEELDTTDYCEDDGSELAPWEIHSYLCRVMYNRRNKFDPLWNSLVVAGVKHGRTFLGTVGMIGQHYEDSHLAAGFGNHMARPLFREKHTDDMSEEDARKLMEDCLRACLMRDKTMMNKFQIAKVTAGGLEISEPFQVPMNWGYEKFKDPTKHAVGAW